MGSVPPAPAALITVYVGALLIYDHSSAKKCSEVGLQISVGDDLGTVGKLGVRAFQRRKDCPERTSGAGLGAVSFQTGGHIKRRHTVTDPPVGSMFLCSVPL